MRVSVCVFVCLCLAWVRWLRRLSLEGVLSQQAAQTASFAATSAEGESGAAAAPNFPSQQTYGEQLAALSSMGFSNREECLEALRRAGGV